MAYIVLSLDLAFCVVYVSLLCLFMFQYLLCLYFSLNLVYVSVLVMSMFKLELGIVKTPVIICNLLWCYLIGGWWYGWMVDLILHTKLIDVMIHVCKLLMIYFIFNLCIISGRVYSLNCFSKIVMSFVIIKKEEIVGPRVQS